MNPPLKFVAIAFNDYGGIGFEFYSAVVRPYFEGLREKEEEAGGSGWDARKQKSEFLQRVSRAWSRSSLATSQGDFPAGVILALGWGVL